MRPTTKANGTAKSANKTVGAKIANHYGKRAGKTLTTAPIGIKPTLSHPPRASYSN